MILPLLVSFSWVNQPKSPQSTLSNSSNLIKKWRVNAPAFIHLGIDNYELSSDNIGFGYFIEFKEDNTFNSYYHASCGNDCFTTTNGTYIIKGDLVEIFVISAQQSGFCSNPISFNNKKIGNFKIVQKTKEKLLLKRI